MVEKKIKVAHIIPTNQIGGVEIGVQKSYFELNKHSDYRPFFLRKKGIAILNGNLLINLIFSVLSRKWRPDIVITSLWKSHLFGFVFKLLGIRWTAFFHSSKSHHFVDKFILYLAWNLASQRLVDSDLTAIYMNKFGARESSIIPYNFKRSVNNVILNDRKYDYIWTGRCSDVKRLDLLLNYLSVLYSISPEAMVCICIASPSENVLSNLKKISNNIEINIECSNERVFDFLLDSKVFILFSDFEGYSMATAEAILAGCLLCIRSVGFFGLNLRKQDCFFIEKLHEVYFSELVLKINKAVSNGEAEVRINAAKCFLNYQPDYVESMVKSFELTTK